jgi:hypothetical protein
MMRQLTVGEKISNAGGSVEVALDTQEKNAETATAGTSAHLSYRLVSLCYLGRLGCRHLLVPFSVLHGQQPT